MQDFLQTKGSLLSMEEPIECISIHQLHNECEVISVDSLFVSYQWKTFHSRGCKEGAIKLQIGEPKETIKKPKKEKKKII